MRAGVYVRISRDLAGEGLGIARQQEDCIGQAKALDWEVAEVYVDNDISATSGKNRPAYRRMLADLERGDIGAIVAWHPDRLYRRVTDLSELVDICKKVNAQISTVNAGNVDLNTPTGRLVAGLLANVAMYEVEHKSERWSRSWQQGRERGVPVTNSRRLFGYERDGVTVVPEEAALTREMTKRLLDGATITSICFWLAEQGVTTTVGNAWRSAGFKRYLLNPRIAGHSTHKGEIIADGQWEPLLDRETWEEVRALLTSRTRTYVPRKALLNGLIFCGECGFRMITHSARGKRSYYCTKRPGMDGCGKVAGTASYIEEMAEEFAKTRLADPRVRQRIADLRAEPSGAQNELAALELRLQELERQLEEPGTPVAAIVRAMERAKERQRELADRLAATPRGALPRPGVDDWPEDLHRRRALVDLVIKRIDLAPRIRPTNKFQPERVTIHER